MTQTKEQAQLQNALTTTFLANLAFLSEYDNELYHRVDELSRMIENGTYKEKYALEFIMENGDFDIYDIVNDKYLYDKKPKKRNDELIKKINFDEKSSIFEIEPYFNFKNDIKVNFEKRFELEKLDELNSLTLFNVKEYTDYTKNYLDNLQKKFKRFDKFIFLGTLLGRHIPKIAEKINATSYLILERNLEIFRLSLFTVDYTILAKKGAIFSIMDTKEDEEKKIYSYLNAYRLDNYFIKISTTNINIDRYIDTILNMKTLLSPVAYDYNRRIYIHTNRTTSKIQKNYRFLDFKSIRETCKLFENIPILYIAAGPSLDENLEWIKDNQDRFFIVCIGRALKKLVSNGISVNIVITLDEQEFLADTQFDDETMKLVSKDTLLFASSITNKNILNKFDKDNIFIFDVFYSFFKSNRAFNGSSIGEIGLEIIFQFNSQEIYILGLDLALDQKTGATHASEDRVKISKIDLNEEQDRTIFNVRRSLVKVKGNFKKEVYTTPLFYGSIKMLEDKVRIKDKKTKIYNLSSNGAKFQGIIPKKSNNVNLDKYENSNTILLKNYLESKIYTKLDGESESFIREEIEYIRGELEKILIDIEKSSQELFFKDFLKSIEKIIIELREKNYKNLNEIVFLYSELCLPYLSYYFNDKKIKSERSKIKEIKMIYIKQIRQIMKDYTFCLERLI